MNKRVGGRYLIYNVSKIKNTVKKISVNNKALLTESRHFYSSYDLNSRTENEHFLLRLSGRETYNYNSYTDEDSRKPGEKCIEKHIDVSYYKLLFLIKPKKIFFCWLSHHGTKGVAWKDILAIKSFSYIEKYLLCIYSVTFSSRRCIRESIFKIVLTSMVLITHINIIISFRKNPRGNPVFSQN